MLKIPMKHGLLGIAVLSVILLSTGCSIFESTPTTPDAIVLKSWHANDPLNKSSEVKTMYINSVSVMPEQKIYGKANVICKFPDKLHVTHVTPGIDTTIVVQNGNNAWVYSSLMGVRRCVDSELEQMMFDLQTMDPNQPLDNFFDKYEFLPEEKPSEWVIKCYPRRDRWKYIFPVTLYIDKNNYMVNKTVGKNISDTNETEATSIIHSRKVFDPEYGIIETERNYEQRDNSKTQSKALEVQYNPIVDDKIFVEPTE